MQISKYRCSMKFQSMTWKVRPSCIHDILHSLSPKTLVDSLLIHTCAGSLSSLESRAQPSNLEANGVEMDRIGHPHVQVKPYVLTGTQRKDTPEINSIREVQRASKVLAFGWVFICCRSIHESLRWRSREHPPKPAQQGLQAALIAPPLNTPNTFYSCNHLMWY